MRRSANSASAAQSGSNAQLEPAVSELQVVRGSANHTVQFYETDEYLLHTVAAFLSAGLRTGNPAIAIVDRDHGAQLSRVFAREVTSGMCRLLDARETLAWFMRDGMPDRERFRNVISQMLELDSTATPLGKTRVFGEMSDILCREGSREAAIELEALWEEALGEHTFALFCCHFIGNFDTQSDTEAFSRVCQSHGRVLPTERFSSQASSQTQAREITWLQHRARAWEAELERRKQLERSLQEALEQRDSMQAELRNSLGRENSARIASDDNDAFKEVFLSTLGHDLLNPLHTILTTSRLMKMRQELAEGTRTRLARIISSGERMQRMIEQIHDLTRSRLNSGLTISKDTCDLVALVARSIGELRDAHPTRSIVLQGDDTCNALVDGRRIEQVVSNLLGNAIAHGDPNAPINVRLCATEDSVTISVHNSGPAIEPELLPLLFQPFTQQRKMRGHSAGLGLGLYISERIIAAHGGTLEVASSEASGTCFRFTLPLR